jgi:RNA polymerase sigma factor (sigma-70 family)
MLRNQSRQLTFLRSTFRNQMNLVNNVPAAETTTVSHGHFSTTHWSVVLSAKQQTSAEADAALERLCRTYWWPLYAFVRRRGYETHDAQDLTQEFFARLLSKDFLRAVDRSKGKFRSFLLGALEHFLAKEWRRANAQKRGGKFTFISTDAESAEQQYLQVPAANLSPEQLFDQQWATTLFSETLSRLRAEFTADGKETQFEAIKIFLTGEKQAESYTELAAKLGTTEAALKMAVSRMRHRYRELLREEIANTVNNPEEIEGELRALFAAVRL